MGKIVRGIGLTLLGLLLLLSLTTATVTIGLDRSVLDDEFTKETLEEEGVYDVAFEEGLQALEEEIEDQENETGEIDTVIQGVEQNLSATYIQEQTEPNIDRTYEFLDGERDELVLSINTIEVKEAVSYSAKVEVRDSSYEELFDEYIDDGEGFEEIGEQIVEMAESEDDYEEIIAENEPILDLNGDRVIDNRGDAEEYADEIGIDEHLQGGVAGFILAHQDAVDDETELEYDEYINRLEESQEDLADGVETLTREEIDESIDDVVSTEVTNNDDEDVALVQSGVSMIGTVSIVLAAFSVLIAVLIFAVANTRSWALWEIGGISALVGGIWILGISTAESFVGETIQTVIEEEEPPIDPTETITGVIGRYLGVFSEMGMVLLLLGIGFVTLGILARKGVGPLADPGQADSTDKS